MLLLAGAAALIGGCRAQGRAPSQRAGEARSVGGTIQVQGSDTMVNLGPAWAEVYMRKHPTVSVAVTGGGSGTGIAGLINGAADVAQASREMKLEEREQARARGREVSEHRVAQDGLTVIVHPSNPVKRLTIQQLADIYTARKTRWKDLGGADRPIVVLSRDKNSGTHVSFLEHVVRQGDPESREEFAARTLMVTSSQSIADEVAANADAIGYVGLGYVDTERHQPVAIAATAAGPYVTPDAATVRSGRYPIARPLFLYTVRNPGPTVACFVAFVLSAEGQQMVQRLEFVPLPPSALRSEGNKP